MVLLDVGCGSGWLHPDFARRGVRVLALDRSAGMAAEAQEQAHQRGLQVLVLRADAQALPVRDASFDRVIALHVLFHVPDVPRALREMQRALRPGGRVVLSTNAAEHSRRLYDLHVEAARSLGYTPGPPPGHNFTLDDLDVVRDVFPGAERHVRTDAFVFHTAEPALRFYASNRIDHLDPCPTDGSHREPLLAAMRQRIEAIIAGDGSFRVPKDSGCFVAEV